MGKNKIVKPDNDLKLSYKILSKKDINDNYNNYPKYESISVRGDKVFNSSTKFLRNIINNDDVFIEIPQSSILMGRNDDVICLNIHFDEGTITVSSCKFVHCDTVEINKLLVINEDVIKYIDGAIRIYNLLYIVNDICNDRKGSICIPGLYNINLFIDDNMNYYISYNKQHVLAPDKGNKKLVKIGISYYQLVYYIFVACDETNAKRIDVVGKMFTEEVNYNKI